MYGCHHSVVATRKRLVTEPVDKRVTSDGYVSFRRIQGHSYMSVPVVSRWMTSSCAHQPSLRPVKNFSPNVFTFQFLLSFQLRFPYFRRSPFQVLIPTCPAYSYPFKTFHFYRGPSILPKSSSISVKEIEQWWDVSFWWSLCGHQFVRVERLMSNNELLVQLK